MRSVSPCVGCFVDGRLSLSFVCVCVNELIPFFSFRRGYSECLRNDCSALNVATIALAYLLVHLAVQTSIN